MPLRFSGTVTCMKNRKDFPKELVKSKANAKRLTQDDSKWVQCVETGIVT